MCCGCVVRRLECVLDIESSQRWFIPQQCYKIYHTVLQLLRHYISHKRCPIACPNRWAMGCLNIVRIFKKFDSIIMAPYCIMFNHSVQLLRVVMISFPLCSRSGSMWCLLWIRDGVAYHNASPAGLWCLRYQPECVVFALYVFVNWEIYRKTSNISRTLVYNKMVDHSDVVGASPVGAAPTTSSYLT